MKLRTANRRRRRAAYFEWLAIWRSYYRRRVKFVMVFTKELAP